MTNGELTQKKFQQGGATTLGPCCVSPASSLPLRLKQVQDELKALELQWLDLAEQVKRMQSIG